MFVRTPPTKTSLAEPPAGQKMRNIEIRENTKDLNPNYQSGNEFVWKFLIFVH
jgi:hypothetical protein